MQNVKSLDTITAVATAPGRGGVGIVRVSGTKTAQIAEGILGILPKIREATYLPFKAADGHIIDEGIALYFKAPHSFTGEDVLELQGHGGPVVMDLLLNRVAQLGARLARPGEFSERAFLNDKLDLAQAEAIADLIDASSEQAARSAMRSLQGEFSYKVNNLVENLIRLRIYIEAALDFPEEEIDFLTEGKVSEQTQTLLSEIVQLQKQAKQGALLREGMTIVIAGRPNAGKSSLLNALAGRESAIVTDIAGTTRDVLREHISINGVPLHIIDTAGLRDTDDIVEQEGVKRAIKALESADRILLVVDIAQRDHLVELQQEFLKNLPRQIPVTIIFNKIDLVHEQSRFEPNPATLYLSAKQGNGLDLLRQHLLDCIGFNQTLEGGFIARRRHLDAIERAKTHIEYGLNQLMASRAGELLAEDLRHAQDALNEITGRFTADDLLGRIFSSFCIGK